MSDLVTASAANRVTPSDRRVGQRSDQRRSIRPWLGIAVVAAYLVIGTFAFWPVFPELLQRPLVGSGSPDFIQAIWFLDWVPHALAHARNPFFSNGIYVPTGVNLAQNTSTPFLALISAPFAPILSPVVRANLLLVLAMPISATAAFVVLRKWRVWGVAAALGGLVYGFSPYMVGQTDHLNLLFVPLPPFIALTIASILQRKGSSRRLGVQLGLLVVAQYLISPEVLATVAVFVVVAVACVVVRNRAAVSKIARDASGAVGIAVVIAFALLAYPVWMGFFGPQHFTGPPGSTTNPYHTDLLSSIVPTPAQRFSLGMQSIQRGLFASTEPVGYIGAPVLVLSGILAWWSRRSSRMQLALVLTGLAVLLSLGPHLAIDGHVTAIPLPFWLLDHVPLLNSALPDRISLEVNACLAAVIAFGLDDMRKASKSSWRRRRSAVFAAVTLAVLIFTQSPQWPQPYLVGSTVALPSTLTRAIPSGDPVAITYPYDVGVGQGGSGPSHQILTQPMLWQAEDSFGFRLLGGYAFHVNPEGSASIQPDVMNPSGTQQFLADQEGYTAFGPEMPVSPTLVALTRSVMIRYDVRVVIVDRSVVGSDAVMELFDDVLGRPTQSADQFSMWAHWSGRPAPREQFSPHISTRVLRPKDGATLSGTVLLNARGSGDYPIAKVDFLLSSVGRGSKLIASRPSFVGWLSELNTATLSNGIYSLQSDAYDVFGQSSRGKTITITIDNRQETSGRT